MKTYKILKLSFITIALIFGIISCGDPVPTDYKPEVMVQAYLYVNEPITNIVVQMTQPLSQSFDWKKSLIRDAQVTITGDGKTFNLIIDSASESGYYYKDTTYKVKSETNYKISILVNGKLIIAETKTPPITKYIVGNKSMFQFPKDTINFPATDSITWEYVPGYFNYILAIKCLDTLEYGKYLTPQTQEKNRRCYNLFAKDQDEYYYNNQGYGFIGYNIVNPYVKTSVVWGVFKWFGRHEVDLIVPDGAYLKWFIQTQIKNEYDPLLSNIKGGKGVFGSASIIRDTSFLLKNQP